MDAPNHELPSGVPRAPRVDGADFRAFANNGDTDALARFFDAAAPRLLLLAAHVAPKGIDPQDLVQQAFLDAMRAKDAQREDGDPFAWLVTILRSRAVDAHRRSSRRPEVALDATLDRADEESDPLLQLASDEAFECVTRTIATLEPEQRDALNLKLVHGLGPTEIAHALGRRPGTVRMQLKRGLERLREKLPDGIAPALASAVTVLLAAESTGLARAREAVLAEARAMPADPTVPVPSTASTLRSLMTPLPLTIAASILALVSGLVVLPDWLGSTNDTSGVPTLTGSPELRSPSIEDVELAVETQQSSVHDEDAPDDDGSEDPDEDAVIALVTGTLVDHTDAPVAGAQIHWLAGTPSPDGSGLEPQDSVATEEDGSFVLASDAKGFDWIALRVAAEDRPQFSLEFALDVGVRNLGTIAYPPSRTLVLQLVDAEGEAVSWLEGEAPRVVHGWRPIPELAPQLGMIGALSARVDATPIDALGRCTITGAPVGSSIQITVNGSAHDEPVEKQYVVTELSPSLLEFVWPHPDDSNNVSIRLVHEAVGSPWIMEPQDEDIRLVLADGDEMRYERLWWQSSEVIDFDAVPAGVHRLEIQVRGFTPATLDGIEPGNHYDVEIEGSARIALRVTDSDGVRLSEYSLEVTEPDTMPLRPVNWRDSAVDQSGFDFFGRVAAVDQDWTIVLPDGRERTRTIRDLSPGETRTLEVLFEEGASIAGTVQSTTGVPMGGVDYELRARQVEYDLPANFVGSEPVALRPQPRPGSFAFPVDSITGTTGADGSFTAPVDPSVEYSLFLSQSPWSWTMVERVAAGDEIDTVLPATRTVNGRVIGIGAESLDVLDLLVRPVTEDALSTDSIEWRPHRIPIDVDGSFELVGLGTGAYSVAIAYPNLIEFARVNGSGGQVHLPAIEVHTIPSGSTDLTDLEVDGSSAAPARITVDATVDGSPIVGGYLSAVDTAPANPAAPAMVALSFGDGGRATVEWLPPGAWSFAVAVQSEPWLVAEPVARQISTNEAVHLSFDAVRTLGSVSLESPDGQPLAGRSVRITAPRHGMVEMNATFTTDADGRFELEAPPGSLALRLKRAEGADGPRWGPQAELLWTASGPAKATVVLEEPTPE